MAVARRKARTVALQALYEADASDHPVMETVDRLVAAENLAESTAKFAQELARGVAEHRAEIDRIIAKAAPLRPIDELAAIDRNVLRVAIYELVFDNRAPVAAVINEAVELARRFGTDNSSKFINGVLGSVSATAAHKAV
jgi:N utilization substance protein B